MYRRAIAMVAAAVAGLLGFGGIQAPPSSLQASGHSASVGQGGQLGNRLANLGGGSLAGLLGSGGGYGGHSNGPRYKNKFPISVAQGKRSARKHRNRLRARGQNKKAVR